MLTADKSKEYCCNSPAKEEEHTRSSNVFICGPSPEDFVAVITPQAFQIHIFVSIPPPVRSVIVITNLQFGKRTLPFSCNLSITATRYLSFRKVPPGSYHDLTYLMKFTILKIEHKLNILWQKKKKIISSRILWQLLLVIITAMKGSNFSVINSSVTLCSGYTELNSTDYSYLLVFILFR